MFRMNRSRIVSPDPGVEDGTRAGKVSVRPHWRRANDVRNVTWSTEDLTWDTIRAAIVRSRRRQPAFILSSESWRRLLQAVCAKGEKAVLLALI
jgi:hypothetical protein